MEVSDPQEIKIDPNSVKYSIKSNINKYNSFSST